MGALDPMRSRHMLHVLLFVTVLLVEVAFTATTAEGKKWLNQNKNQDGVIETKTGLQYKIVKSGGPDGISPGPNSAKGTVERSGVQGSDSGCGRGSLIDGTVFDSSVERGKPTQFIPSQVVPGCGEALQLMKEGDEWEIFLPSELAYGDKKVGKHIKPGAVLIFTLELIKVDPPPGNTKATGTILVSSLLGLGVVLFIVVMYARRDRAMAMAVQKKAKGAMKKLKTKAQASVSSRHARSKYEQMPGDALVVAGEQHGDGDGVGDFDLGEEKEEMLEQGHARGSGGAQQMSDHSHSHSQSDHSHSH